MRRLCLLLLIINILSFNHAYAAQYPRNGSADARIKTIIYNSRDVVVIKGHYGYTTTIQFADDEMIENISIGDSLAWQVAPNSKGNLLFVKPIEDNATTNLVIVTTMRTYNFELNANEAYGSTDSDLTFNLRFVYPEDEQKALAKVKEIEKTEVVPGRRVNPNDWNMDYTYKGHKQVVPLRAFDDGVFTYFKFNKKLSTPAIFFVDENRNESLLNYHVDGEYIVVQRIGKQFTIRNGDYVACVFNENYEKHVLAKSYLKKH